MIPYLIDSKWNTSLISLRLWMNVIGGLELRIGDWRRRLRRMLRLRIWWVLFYLNKRAFGCDGLTGCVFVKMREIAEIELAIQGGTEKIETLGK